METPPAPEASRQCVADRDCADGKACVDGACVQLDQRKPRKRRPKPAPVSNAQPFTPEEEAAAGTTCTENTDCVGELVCEEGVCVKPPECRKDADCPKNLTCDTSMGRCRDPICIVDEDCPSNICVYGRCKTEAPECRGRDCPPDHFCIPETGQCEPQFCKNDDDCADGRQCDGRTCRECLKDDQCPGAQTCYAVDGICREPKTCTENQDCVGRRVCDAATQTCAPEPCEPDPFGANNKRETAVPIQEGTFRGTLCAGESDWFMLDMQEGDGLQVHITFDKNFGGLEGRFYQPNDRIELIRWNDGFGAGAVTGAYEKTGFNGPHYVRVKHVWGQSLPYSLRVDFVPQGRCIDDVYEPNASYREARHAPVNFPFTMRLCPDDEDWFLVEVPANNRIQVKAAVDKGRPPTLALYRKDSGKGGEPAFIERTPDSGTGAETPVMTYQGGDAIEALYIRAVYNDPEAENRYRLYVLNPDQNEQILHGPDVRPPDTVYLDGEPTPLDAMPKRTNP